MIHTKMAPKMFVAASHKIHYVSDSLIETIVIGSGCAGAEYFCIQSGCFELDSSEVYERLCFAYQRRGGA